MSTGNEQSHKKNKRKKTSKLAKRKNNIPDMLSMYKRLADKNCEN